MKEMKWAVCDIEARNWINFLCIGFYDGVEFRCYTTLDHFFNDIFSLQYSTYFAHFGGIYDFLFLLDYIFRTPKKYRLNSLIPRGSGILSFKVSMGKRTITFCDSSAFLPFSLRSLAKNFNVETQKGFIDYNKIKKVTKKLVTYLEGDCKALYQVIQRYSEWPLINDTGLKLTIASQALSIFKKMYESGKKKLIPLDRDIEAFIRDGYKGGRTEIFRPYFYSAKKNLYYYDVNSLYPFVMFNNNYPKSFSHYTTEFERNRLAIYHCRVDVPSSLSIPILGLVYEGKYIFPTGQFDGMWTSAELNYAKSLGCKILKIYQGVVFNSGGKFFKKYVTKLYDIRKKAEKNSVDDVLAKLLLNSLYGRFGIDLEKETLVLDDNSENLIPYISFEIKKNVFVRLAKKPTRIRTYSDVSISTFVTGYARIHMHKLYMKCQNEIYYTDTDSIITTKKFKTSLELGGLKLVKEINHACFLLPKTYALENKKVKSIVMKGFDQKKIQQFSVDDFHTALEGDLRRLKADVDARPARFKSALRSKKLLTMTEKSTKKIRSKYDKREIYKNQYGEWVSRPIHITPINEGKSTWEKQKKSFLKDQLG